ncbi:MAG: hypothetical protein C0602_02680 [Denitrovibrio sp.]|nr:MAG: hypothetical protein C0602_02680 [Denitrovibrio sp.]
MRLSKKLADKYDISVRTAKRYIKDGLVELDGEVIKKDPETDSENILLNTETSRPKADPSEFLIRSFDNLVFFDKPAFMHTDLQKPDDPLTMQDVLTAYSEDFDFISRLDYTTDGVICAVRKGFFVFETKKVYLAYVEGEFKETVAMDNLIDADKKRAVKVLPENGGYKTLFAPVSYKNGISLVRAELENAARHQIRAYLAHLGYPILGDSLYGAAEKDRIYLHCKETFVNKFPGISNLTDNFSFSNL